MKGKQGLIHLEGLRTHNPTNHCWQSHNQIADQFMGQCHRDSCSCFCIFFITGEILHRKLNEVHILGLCKSTDARAFMVLGQAYTSGQGANTGTLCGTWALTLKPAWAMVGYTDGKRVLQEAHKKRRCQETRRWGARLHRSFFGQGAIGSSNELIKSRSTLLGYFP